MHDRLKTTGSHPTGNLSEPKHRTRSACGRGLGRSLSEVPWEEGDSRRLAHSGRPRPRLRQELPPRPGRAQQNSDRRRKRKRHAGGRAARRRQDRVQAGETLAPSHTPSSLGARPHGHWGPPSRGRCKQFPSRWFLEHRSVKAPAGPHGPAASPHPGKGPPSVAQTGAQPGRPAMHVAGSSAGRRVSTHNSRDKGLGRDQVRKEK